MFHIGCWIFSEESFSLAVLIREEKCGHSGCDRVIHRYRRFVVNRTVLHLNAQAELRERFFHFIRPLGISLLPPFVIGHAVFDKYFERANAPFRS